MIKKFSLIKIEAAISFSDYEEAENIKNQTALGNQYITDYQRQITLRIVGYHFSSQLTASLTLCLIYLKFLVHML